VIGVDVNPQKVALLKTGESPIVEPQLRQLLSEEWQRVALLQTLKRQ